ncbi:NAD(P)/FAD-dependent oxidoreductase [Alkalibacillus almallahensis]|uniref:NAD(P)/FAD-dependent oxidoreductase n=1 Tax=Alkalibacillus almallahensis TaxID=1379154 RepID=UPI001421F64E|nr:NAD(P)/FAD-dependent oxidoreductase [Alkalibacillus almallahensis]NIK11348.1 thioredoxin reductase (NADPH) [Alkalibacillus almallahensis]
MTHDLYDVTIIGGGPAGLYSAFYSGLRGMKTKIIEYQNVLGGKVNVYPEKMIWDVGGQPPVTGETFMNQLIEQGLTFDPTVIYGEKVVSMQQDEDGLFYLTGDSGNKHWTKTVIVAVGSGILKPQKLKIDNADRFEVSNLNYTVKSLKRFQDKTVIISGGGNSAIDWANELEPIAKKVFVTCRKDHLSGHEAQVDQLMNSNATCLFNSCIANLVPCPDREMIEYVEVLNQETNEVEQVAVDEVIVNHGYEMDAELLQKSELNLNMVDDYFIEGNATSETSVPGVFAAGDILKHDGKLNLIAGTFQDAANAVNQAKQFISPDSSGQALVSSHNDVFKERNEQLKQQMLDT